MSDAGSGTGDRCEHFAAIQPLHRVAEGCEECLAMGAAWTELRVCLTCGHVGCCEDSVHAHALQHFNTSGHPLIVPLERHETWGWCYVHRRYFDPMPALPFKQPSPSLGFLRRFRDGRIVRTLLDVVDALRFTRSGVRPSAVRRRRPGRTVHR